MDTIRYNRITLKLSGEALASTSEQLFDSTKVQSLTAQIAQLAAQKIQISIVPGGGNVFRGRDLSPAAQTMGLNNITADHVGMLATVINALVLRDAFVNHNTSVNVYTPHRISGLTEPYDRHQVLQALSSKTVAICAGGTGNPLVTTDTAAALRAIELRADAILKATNVDGVYESDPLLNRNASRFEKLTFDEVIDKNLKVMDQTAFSLCRDHNIPIIVYNHKTPSTLERIVRGEQLGTIIQCS